MEEEAIVVAIVAIRLAGGVGQVDALLCGLIFFRVHGPVGLELNLVKTCVGS